MTVYCENCGNVEKYSRKQSTYQWLCRMFPRQPRGAISPKTLDVDAPFERCIEVNKFNNCDQFEVRKDDGHPETVE